MGDFLVEIFMFNELNNHLIIVTNMVESKAKGNTQRARIAHKLAKYYRATHVHLSGLSGDSAPSVSHLSTRFSIKDWEVPPKEDSEIRITLGTPQTMRRRDSQEPTPNPTPQPEGSPSRLGP